MRACVIDKKNIGNLEKAIKVVDLPVPEIKQDDEVLLKMKTGLVMHNTLWIAKGEPVDLAKPKDHIIGSGGVGEVVAVGKKVKHLQIGSLVTVSCAKFVNKSLKILGYETSGGSFADYCNVKDYMCVPIHDGIHMGGASSFNNVATSWQMLYGWNPHILRPGKPVLIWGASGGIGSIAVHIVRKHGGIPIAITSSEKKQKYCLDIGAEKAFNRKDYPHLNGDVNNNKSMTRFIRDVRAVTGELPDIVFEHTGKDTIATSIKCCDSHGMIVICGATSGFSLNIDVRRIWMSQKRFQGSHFCRYHHFDRVIEECNDCAFDNLVNFKKYSLEDLTGLLVEIDDCSEEKILNNSIITINEN